MNPTKLSAFIPVCGIYKITNTRNGKIYIGKSVNLGLRWFTHVSDLTSGKHINKNMLKDFQKMGADAFVVEIIEECDASLLLEREWHYMDQHHKNGCNLYNISGLKGDSIFNANNSLSADDLAYRVQNKKH